jgi:hypothetical protein
MVSTTRLRNLQTEELEAIIAVEDDQEVGSTSEGYDPASSLNNLN